MGFTQEVTASQTWSSLHIYSFVEVQGQGKDMKLMPGAILFSYLFQEESDEYNFSMWYHLVLWLIVIFLWWKWRDGENLDEVDPEGKYIFITGCDSGFGKLAAMTFDRRGFQVIAGCLTEKGAKELKEESSANLQTVQLDVTKSDNIKQVAEQVKKEVGQRGKQFNPFLGCFSLPTKYRVEK